MISKVYIRYSLALLATVFMNISCGDPSGDHRGESPEPLIKPEPIPLPGPRRSPTNEALVQPGCADGDYNEPLPNQTADLSDLIAAYSPSRALEITERALSRRYPTGAFLVAKTKADAQCSQFLQGKASAQEQFVNLSTSVHECGHMADLRIQNGNSNYILSGSKTLSCPSLRKTFALSLIRKDRYQSLRPPCGSGTCDSYANTYLSGNPDNSVFEMGDQGFDILFEEMFQYVNSLAVSYAFADQVAERTRTSQVDGIATLMWYVERYLKLARTSHPAQYEQIAGDACWRDAVLTVWGRANLYVEAAKAFPQLSISGDDIMDLVRDPELVSEITALRERHSCRQ